MRNDAEILCLMAFSPNLAYEQGRETPQPVTSFSPAFKLWNILTQALLRTRFLLSLSLRYEMDT